MKKIIPKLLLVAAAIVAVVLLKRGSETAALIWAVSNKGTWLLPLVLVSAVLDSVHPCSFSILLITIALLFGLQMTRPQILKIGGTYIAGIFAAYLLIGLGLLKVLHLFNTPHFMGKLGAALLIAFGAINVINSLFPKFPLKLKLPTASHTAMSRLMEKASLPAALGLGILVGICQFPCMGGPYLMVIGLLHDRLTYMAGVWYLVLYNLLLIIPLLAVLWVAGDQAVVDKIHEWKSANLKRTRLVAGVIMFLLGILIFFI